jgi:hypothetical protein
MAPSLDFTVSSTNGGVTAELKIGGTVSHPKIALTSTPELPRDEVLAQLLFGRSANSLSPFEHQGSYCPGLARERKNACGCRLRICGPDRILALLRKVQSHQRLLRIRLISFQVNKTKNEIKNAIPTMEMVLWTFSESGFPRIISMSRNTT